MKSYTDVALPAKERAKLLLDELTLEEKVRQISCSSVLMIMPLEMQDLLGGTGAVTIGLGKSERFLDDVREVQDYVMAHSPHHIPALFHTEGLAGPLCLFGGNQYPISIGLGAAFEPELVEEMASFTRRQLAANGVRHALSPVCDLARDLRWGRCNETYGGDATLASAMTVAFVKGMQGENLKEGVAATCKHFLGYSASEGALNSFQTLLSENQLREQYAKPFEAAIHEAGLKTVMNSYSAINGRPVTANKKILNDLLREDLHFDGTVVADYGSINQIKSPYRLAEDNVSAARMALEAGLDVEFPERAVYTEELVAAVRGGELDEALIDRSALRILTLKFELGLFEDPYGVGDYAAAMDNAAPNRGSRLAAKKSMALLKNDGVLPIEDRQKKIAVIGPVGNTLRLLYSHYTATSMREMVASLMKEKAEAKSADIVNVMNQGREEGADGAAPQPKSITDKYFFDGEIRKAYPDAKTIFEALSERFENVSFVEGCDYKGDDTSGFAEALELAERSDIVIFAVGEKSGIDASCTSGEGVDATSLSLPGVQEELVKAVCAVNPNAVIVHTGCRPLCWEWAYAHIPAILEAWFPSTHGAEAIAAVLTGEYDPAGRTPVDLPRDAAHTPVYHCQYNGSSAEDRQGMDGTGYADSPSTSLRPFGFGLSYTRFAYRDLVLREEDGCLVLAVTVENVGGRDGEEVVQLYGSDVVASMVRPRQELLGFKRVPLKAGESKRVFFSFHIDILSFVGEDGKWLVEAGRFDFFVGSHSKDKRLAASYTLQETEKIDPNHRTFFAQAWYE